jgi:hypothetical protein
MTKLALRASCAALLFTAAIGCQSAAKNGNCGADCGPLPPLALRDVARHSSVAVSGAQIVVAAYDGEHGDLVVHTFDKADLSKPVKSEFLDGVPETGHIGGDVAGPRHGIDTPGRDVGQYTALAASPTGDLFLAYYDADGGDLKFTARYDGQWIAPIVVDGSSKAGAPTGDVGLYNSIALTSAGIPAIAYFRRASADSGGERGTDTGLVYAIAGSRRPRTRDDWTVIGDVAHADQRDASSARQDLPAGTGLMPSLQFIDDRPVVAWYDSNTRSLAASIGAGSPAEPRWSAPVTIDGDDGSKRDVGRFPALAIAPFGTPGGRIVIAFPDQTMQQLLVYQFNDLSAHAPHDGAAARGLIHVVDDGIWKPGDGAWHAQTRPGAQTAAAFTRSGRLALAYQDAARVDLSFALWDPAQRQVVSRSTLGPAGVGGFWPRLALDGTTAYVSSATIKTAGVVAQNALRVDAQPAP